MIYTHTPVVEIGGEVNEGLEAKFLEEIGVVYGESVVGGNSAPFRRLLLQTLHLLSTEVNDTLSPKRHWWFIVELVEFAWIARCYLFPLFSYFGLLLPLVCVCVCVERRENFNLILLNFIIIWFRFRCDKTVGARFCFPSTTYPPSEVTMSLLSTHLHYGWFWREIDTKKNCRKRKNKKWVNHGFIFWNCKILLILIYYLKLVIF